MDKKEFQLLLKRKMNELGFKSRGNNHYKIIDDNYLIGVCLDSGYGKSYYIECGALYLPDTDKMPFKGCFDWRTRFRTTKIPGDDLSKYPIENIDAYNDFLYESFDYDKRSEEELEHMIDVNLEKILPLLYDKNFALNRYRLNPRALAFKAKKFIEKIYAYGGFDKEELIRLHKEYGWEDELELD